MDVEQTKRVKKPRRRTTRVKSLNLRLSSIALLNAMKDRDPDSFLNRLNDEAIELLAVKRLGTRDTARIIEKSVPKKSIS